MKTQIKENAWQPLTAMQDKKVISVWQTLGILCLLFVFALCLQPSLATAEILTDQDHSEAAELESETSSEADTTKSQSLDANIEDLSQQTHDKVEETDSLPLTAKELSALRRLIAKEATPAADTHEPPAQDTDDAALSPEELEELRLAIEADSIEAPSVPVHDRSIGSSMTAAIQSMNPDMALILDVALAYFSEKDHYQSGAHDPHQLGFNFQQLEMSLAASIDHYFRFDANLVFSLAGVEIEEAYVTTLSMPWSLQIRAGQFLTRVGRLNSTHPHSWDFVDQPFIIGKLYGGEGNRGLGFELSWLTPLPWYVELVGSAHMPTGNSTNRSFLGKTDEIIGLQDLLYTLAIKQFFPLGEKLGLFWGLSAQFAPNDTGNDNRSDIYATDIYLKWRPDLSSDGYVALQAENFFRLRQIPNDLLFDTGGYAQIVWQINSEWQTGLRGEWGTGVDGDPIDPFWTRERGRAAISATWMGTHFSRLRAQASIDVPKWQSSPIYSLMLSLEVVAGTHPAHNY